MRSAFDLKHDIGHLHPETLDDLWILSHIITPGLPVTAKTVRSVEIIREGQLVKVGKRTVTLTLLIEKCDYTGDRLRLSGKIIDAPPDVERGYHSLEIVPDSELQLVKKWKQWEVDRIRAAVRPSEPVLVVIIDWSETDIWMLRERPQLLVHIPGVSLAKEAGIGRKPEYYGNVLAAIKQHESEIKHIVLAGPGFAREEFVAQTTEREPDLVKRITMDATAHTGEPGLSELLRRGTIARLSKGSRIAEESAAVEIVLTEIAKGGLAFYGSDVAKAVELGAVERLLVCDKKVREYEAVLENAEKLKGKVMIVSTAHTAGERLLGLGGIAAMLRYKPSW